MSKIVSIEITHHRLPLDPAFKASWEVVRATISTRRSCASATTKAARASAPAT